ncbi:MAG TPA: hypothetical protein VGY31_02495 [Terriglobia bacterium]|nr:hypothetical protein [Terriglobia bacterium]
MIPIVQQPEPATFTAKVRIPGKAFLKKKPNPTSEDFKKAKAQYWNRSLDDLTKAYKNICAYCCFYLPLEGSVDHFKPKTKHPTLAYEWSNFRLAHSKINSYKGNSETVLDPFNIQPGWFVLDFTNFHVRANPTGAANIRTQVEETIRVLRLNLDDSLVKFRFSIVRDYSKGDITMNFLETHYPFIAAELKRQAKQHSIKGIIP